MRIVILLLLFVFFDSNIYALDWKALNEQSASLEAKEIADVSPRSSQELYTYALVNLRLHREKEAGLLFEQMLALDPGSIEAKWGQAEILRRTHKIKQSAELIEEILRESPNFYPAFITLAYIKYMQRDFKQTVILSLAVINDSKNADRDNYVRALLIYGGAKGMIAHFGGPLSKAINGAAIMPALRKAEAMSPHAPETLFGMGTFYLLAPPVIGGDLKKAGDYLERAIKADPLFADAYVRLAQLYKARGDEARFREYLDRALNIDPQNELALDIKEGHCLFICK
jgi:tetratricopeptide (TPR) repeat protein